MKINTIKSYTKKQTGPKTTSKIGTYKGKSLKPGGGGRFAKMVDAITATGKSVKSAEAIAASKGRKKYGTKTMTAWAKAGKKRAKGITL